MIGKIELNSPASQKGVSENQFAPIWDGVNKLIF
jgi:hypothetical protein